MSLKTEKTYIKKDSPLNVHTSKGASSVRVSLSVFSKVWLDLAVQLDASHQRDGYYGNVLSENILIKQDSRAKNLSAQLIIKPKPTLKFLDKASDIQQLANVLAELLNVQVDLAKPDSLQDIAYHGMWHADAIDFSNLVTTFLKRMQDPKIRKRPSSQAVLRFALCLYALQGPANSKTKRAAQLEELRKLATGTWTPQNMHAQPVQFNTAEFVKQYALRKRPPFVKSEASLKLYLIGLFLTGITGTLGLAHFDTKVIETYADILNEIKDTVWIGSASVVGARGIFADFEKNQFSVQGKKTKQALTLFEFFWQTIALPTTSLVGAAAVMQKLLVSLSVLSQASTHVLFMPNPVAVMVGPFAFSGLMFLRAARIGYDAYQSWKLSQDVDRLRMYRLKKAESMAGRIKTLSQTYRPLEEKLEKLEAKPVGDRSREEEKALKRLRASLHKLEPTIRLVHQLERKHERLETQNAILKSEQALPGDQQKLTGYLQKKAHLKFKEKRFEAIAWSCGGVGALFGGLVTLVTAVANPVLGAGLGAAFTGLSTVFYKGTSTLKLRRALTMRRVNQHRAQVFATHADVVRKKTPALTGEPLAHRIKDDLIKAYFKLNSDKELAQYKKALSSSDIELIVDFQCETEYKKPPSVFERIGIFARKAMQAQTPVSDWGAIPSM